MMPDMRKKIEEYIIETLDPEIKRLEDDVNASHKNEISNWYERADWVEATLGAYSEVRNDLKMLLKN